MRRSLCPRGQASIECNRRRVLTGTTGKPQTTLSSAEQSAWDSVSVEREDKLYLARELFCRTPVDGSSVQDSRGLCCPSGAFNQPDLVVRFPAGQRSLPLLRRGVVYDGYCRYILASPCCLVNCEFLSTPRTRVSVLCWVYFIVNVQAWVRICLQLPPGYRLLLVQFLVGRGISPSCFSEMLQNVPVSAGHRLDAPGH